MKVGPTPPTALSVKVLIRPHMAWILAENKEIEALPIHSDVSQTGGFASATTGNRQNIRQPTTRSWLPGKSGGLEGSLDVKSPERGREQQTWFASFHGAAEETY